MTNFDKKLRYIMDINGYRARDVIEQSVPYQERIGATLSRQDLSSYLKGLTVPKSKKLLLLCKTLHVDPEYFTIDDEPIIETDLTFEEMKLVKGWRACSDAERDIIRYVMTSHGITLSKENEEAV